MPFETPSELNGTKQYRFFSFIAGDRKGFHSKKTTSHPKRSLSELGSYLDNGIKLEMC